MNTNRKAFLDMLALSEGTSNHPATKCNGYDVIVTGVDGVPETFVSWADHPFAGGRKPKAINSKGLYSTASGRYQFMLRDWTHYRRLLGLDDKTNYPDGPFSPRAQDDWAIQLIRERSALPLIDMGEVGAAIRRVRNLWASLPGAGYGQPEHSAEKLVATYEAAGGSVAA